MAGSSHVIRAALGGALLVNAIPHGVNGVSGRPFPTPFPTPFAAPPGVGLSAPWVNVVWSSANALGAAVLLRGGRLDRGAALAFAAAAVGTAVALSRIFAADR